MKPPSYPSQSGAIFFGPVSNLREILLEEIFLLQYHLKMSYSDSRSLPIPYRKWFLNRLAEEFKKNEEVEKNRPRESFEPDRRRSEDVPMGEMNLEAQRRAARPEKKFK